MSRSYMYSKFYHNTIKAADALTVDPIQEEKLLKLQESIGFTEEDIRSHQRNCMIMAAASYYEDIKAAKYYFERLRNHLRQLFPEADLDTELKTWFQARKNLSQQQLRDNRSRDNAYL